MPRGRRSRGSRGRPMHSRRLTRSGSARRTSRCISSAAGFWKASTSRLRKAASLRSTARPQLPESPTSSRSASRRSRLRRSPASRRNSQFRHRHTTSWCAHTAVMSSSRRTTAQAAGLLLAGAAAGGVLAVTFGASASSPSAGPSGPASYAANGPGPGGYAGPGGHHGPGRFGAMQAGSVTSVDAKSVTIKSTAGTKTYAVDANSDIDKNGEAKLSDLKAGDAVHFAVRPGTSTIAVLHAGDEALNRPAFGSGHHGGPCPGGHHDGEQPAPGASPAPSSSS